MALELHNLDATLGRVLGDVYQDIMRSPATLHPRGDQMDLTGQAVRTIQGFDPKPFFDVLKPIGIVMTIVAGVLSVWILLKMNRYFSERAARLRAEIRPPEKAEGSYDAKWKEVKEHLGSFRDAEWKFAVIEADKMIESILEQAGFLGETLGEKLKAIDKSQLQSIDDLWSAHKLRNLIAHDPNYHVQHRDAREAIGNYEKALRELGVLS